MLPIYQQPLLLQQIGSGPNARPINIYLCSPYNQRYLLPLNQDQQRNLAVFNPSLGTALSPTKNQSLPAKAFGSGTKSAFHKYVKNEPQHPITKVIISPEKANNINPTRKYSYSTADNQTHDHQQLLTHTVTPTGDHTQDQQPSPQNIMHTANNNPFLFPVQNLQLPTIAQTGSLAHLQQTPLNLEKSWDHTHDSLNKYQHQLLSQIKLPPPPQIVLDQLGGLGGTSQVNKTEQNIIHNINQEQPHPNVNSNDTLIRIQRASGIVPRSLEFDSIKNKALSPYGSDEKAKDCLLTNNIPDTQKLQNIKQNTWIQQPQENISFGLEEQQSIQKQQILIQTPNKKETKSHKSSKIRIRKDDSNDEHFDQHMSNADEELDLQNIHDEDESHEFSQSNLDENESILDKLIELGDSGRNKNKTFEGIPKQWHQTIRVKNPDTQRVKLYFKCKYPDCGSVFKKSCNLRDHFRKHTGLRPFKCPFCQKTFTQSGNLGRHLKNVHGTSRENVHLNMNNDE
eukprot:403373258